MEVSAVPAQSHNDPRAVNLNEAERRAGPGCTRPYGHVSDRGMKRRKEKQRKRARMKGWKRKLTKQNEREQEERVNVALAHLLQGGGGGGGIERSTMKSKLPGINLNQQPGE